MPHKLQKNVMAKSITGESKPQWGFGAGEFRSIFHDEFGGKIQNQVNPLGRMH